jgi:hypothetical protein
VRQQVHASPPKHVRDKARAVCKDHVFAAEQITRHAGEDPAVAVGVVFLLGVGNEVPRHLQVLRDLVRLGQLRKDAPAKQGSSDFVDDPMLVDEMDVIFNRVVLEALDAYNRLLVRGVAPEQARAVLPQGTYTEWWWTGSLSAYARIYAQRVDAHAQWEVQQYAQAISQIIAPLFPHSWKALTTLPT